MAYGFIILVVSCLLLAVSCWAEPLDTKIENAISQYVVSKNPAWENSKIKVTFRLSDQNLERLSSYGDTVSFSVPEMYANSSITPNIILPLQVLENGVEKERIFIQANIQLFSEVVSSARILRKNYAFLEADLKLKETDVLKIKEEYYLSKDPLIGKQTKGYIPNGSIITGNMVKDIPTVAANQEVKILAEGEGVRIEAEGIAQQDGKVGESIKIKRQNCNQLIDAKVISPGIVEVQL